MGISTSHLREETHNIPLRIAKGHFATNRCHVNYYVDMTYTKHRLAEAHEAARELVRKMDKSSPIDSILCLEGTEVLGTCIAEELIQDGIRNKGFSIIDVASICPTYYGRKNKKGDAVEMMKWQRDRGVTVEQAAKMDPEQLKDKLVIGLLHHAQYPEFTYKYDMLIKKLAEEREANE